MRFRSAQPTGADPAASPLNPFGLPSVRNHTLVTNGPRKSTAKMQQLLTSASGERVPKADIAVHRQPMIRILEMEGISVREDVLFSNHKYDEKKRIRARNEKRLKILRPALERVMLPGEAVFYI